MKKFTKKVYNEFKNSDRVLERLTLAIIEHGVPIDSFSDIANYGAQNGYPAISYYSDTCEFYNKHKDDIWDFATDEAEQLGNSNVFEMIANFNGAKNVGGCNQFENLMCWYIAEEVSRFVIENYKIVE